MATLDVLRSPNFALLWSAQVISAFGDKITFFALAFVTWQITHSAFFTAFAVVIATVPYALFGFFGGTIADAVGHRRAMIACDLTRVFVIGIIPAAIASGAPLAIPYALVFVAALCSAVFAPARMGLVPDLVPRTHLGASNSIVVASDRTVEVVGSVIAGLVVAWLGTLAFYVDAGTFALSAVLLMRIDLVDRPARSIRIDRIWREAAEGVRFLATNTVLRANTIFSLAGQLCIPVLNSLTPVLIFREFGMGPEQLGAAEAALAAGAVAGGIVLPALFSRLPKGNLVVLGFATYGLDLVAIGATPTFAVALVLFFAAGFTNVLFFVPNVTISQEVAPPEIRARVFGTRMALLNITWLPIVLAGGAFADTVSAGSLIAIAGAFTVLVAIVGSRVSAVRDVP